MGGDEPSYPPMPLSKSKYLWRKSVSSSGSNYRGSGSEVSLPVSLVGKRVGEDGCVCLLISKFTFLWVHRESLIQLLQESGRSSLPAMKKHTNLFTNPITRSIIYQSLTLCGRAPPEERRCSPHRSIRAKHLGRWKISCFQPKNEELHQTRPTVVRKAPLFIKLPIRYARRIGTLWLFIRPEVFGFIPRDQLALHSKKNVP